MADRFKVTAAVVGVVLAVLLVYAMVYVHKKLSQPKLATLATTIFAFMFAMLWGMAEAGVEPAQQVLVFASIEFLVAGLVVLQPLISIVFFVATFSLFGFMLDWSGLMTPQDHSNLIYLATLDIIVSFVVYGLFVRGVSREREVADRSRRDELTGAKNRHYLRDDFAEYVGKDLLVMLCDIDDFKHCNDNYGHDVGDTVIREFFFALRSAFGDESTYRYGGDEFLVVTADCNDAELSYNLEKVEILLAKVTIEGNNITLAYSAGYVRGVALDNNEFRTMLHQADENLFKAKHAGKNRVLGN